MQKDKKERLKPISFYGHKPEDVIRAFMQVDPKRMEERRRDDKPAREHEERVRE